MKGGKVRAHIFGKIGIILHFFWPMVKNCIERMDKFLLIEFSNQPQVAEYPATRFKIPIVSQPNKTKIGGDIREKRKLAATYGTVVAFTKSRSLASQKEHVHGEIVCQGGWVGLFLAALIPPPGVPERRAGL